MTSDAYNFFRLLKKKTGLPRNKKTWDIVSSSGPPTSANVMGGSSERVIDKKKTETEIWKARFVVQGPKEYVKFSLFMVWPLFASFQPKYSVALHL